MKILMKYTKAVHLVSFFLCALQTICYIFIVAAIVLSPSAELCSQTAQVLQTITSQLPNDNTLTVKDLTSTSDYQRDTVFRQNKQRHAHILENIHGDVLVATPNYGLFLLYSFLNVFKNNLQ
jgi:hypothetical protein